MNTYLNSVQEIADHFSVSEAEVQRWKAEGCPALNHGDGPYYVPAIDEWLRNAHLPSAQLADKKRELEMQSIRSAIDKAVVEQQHLRAVTTQLQWPWYKRVSSWVGIITVVVAIATTAGVIVDSYNKYQYSTQELRLAELKAANAVAGAKNDIYNANRERDRAQEQETVALKAAEAALAAEAQAIKERELADAAAKAAREQLKELDSEIAAKKRSLAVIARMDTSDSSGAPVEIDVMIVYTEAVADSVPDVADLCDEMVETTNVTFENSGLNVVLNLVHAAGVQYEESRTVTKDLERLRNKADGYMDDIHALREEHRADIVMFVVENSSVASLASAVLAKKESAFGLVSRSSGVSYYSFAHTIGLLMGARHNARVDPSDEPFAFGHGYVKPGKWRTVMSYNVEGEERIPYWSSPLIKYQDEPVGNAETSDNARVIRQTAPYVASFL